ncbi:hypothetical protein VNI00_004597 [Paramarasmius palmivorus]|uniref:F-box domain-containing protein n=1 Tax=Paramarasmius palmivorus TaxID=297713 RepID=A0AAW0DIA7_9AGAR
MANRRRIKGQAHRQITSIDYTPNLNPRLSTLYAVEARSASVFIKKYRMGKGVIGNWLQFSNLKKAPLPLDGYEHQEEPLEPASPLRKDSTSSVKPAKFCYLPDDILYEIFRHFLPKHSKDNLRLVLTHVCRQWRAVACDMPSLWAFPDLSNPNLGREMLRRSLSDPPHPHYPLLHVHFQYMKYHPRTFAQFTEEYTRVRMEAASEALSQFERIETLRLNMPSRQLVEVASKLVQAVPFLRSLDLTSDGVDLSPGFLGGGAPFLSALSLKYCGLAIKSPLLPNITSLELTGGGRTTFERRLRDVLSVMPLLEHLILHDVFHHSHNDAKVALLPNLRQLDLDFSDIRCTATLHYMSFPPTTVVHIRGHDLRLPEEHSPDLSWLWEPISRILAPGFYPERERSVKTLTANGDDAYAGVSLTLKAWDTALPYDFDKEAPPSRPHLIVEVDWCDGRWAPYGSRHVAYFVEVFAEGFFTLPLPGLEILHLGAFPRESPSISYVKLALRPHLQSSTLRTLVVHGEYCVEYIPGLLVFQPEDSSPLPFPALETVVFSYVDFRLHLVQGLIESLGERSMQGKKLQKVVMIGCRSDKDCPMSLFEHQEITKEVDWDG